MRKLPAILRLVEMFIQGFITSSNHNPIFSRDEGIKIFHFNIYTYILKFKKISIKIKTAKWQGH